MVILVPLSKYLVRILNSDSMTLRIFLLGFGHDSCGIVSIPHSTLSTIVNSSCGTIVVSELNDDEVTALNSVYEGVEAAFLGKRSGRAPTNGHVDNRDGKKLSKILTPSYAGR